MALVASVAVACGAVDDGPAAHDEPTSNESDAERASACGRYFDAAIHGGGVLASLELHVELECGAPLPPVAADALRIVRDAYVYRCAALYALPSVGRTAQALGACAEALEGLPCGAPTPAACMALDVPGRRLADEPCTSGLQCRSGACLNGPCGGRCSVGGANDGDRCTTVCRSCIGTGCGPGLVCTEDATSTEQFAGICRRTETLPPVPPPRCVPGGCKAGLECQPTGKCEPPYGLGVDCNHGGVCAPELYCGSPPVCTPRVPIGGDCGVAQCAPRAYCNRVKPNIFGTCVARAAVGAPCDSRPNFIGASCVDRARCEGDPPLRVHIASLERVGWPGEPCDGIDKGCIFGECVAEDVGMPPTRCPALATTGAPCAATTACVYGLCGKDSKCEDKALCQAQ